MTPTRSIGLVWSSVLLSPAIFVSLAGTVVYLLKHRTPLVVDRPEVFWEQCVIAASPFFVLAVLSSLWALVTNRTALWRKARMATYAGMISMAIPWTLHYIDALVPRPGGVNIGLGLLVFTSPVWVGIIMLITFAVAMPDYEEEGSKTV